MSGRFAEIYEADVAPLASPALFTRAYARMPSDRQAKIDRFTHEEGKLSSLGAGLLLHMALAKRDLDSAALRFGVGAHGKPFLPDFPGLRFNLSHAGTRVLCVVSDLECGCDVECFGRGSDRLARRFFSPAENRLLSEKDDTPDPSGQPTPKDRLFTLIWTRKESLLKARGTGLSVPLNDFSVFDPPGDVLFVDLSSSARTASCVCLLDPDGSPVTLSRHFVSFEEGVFSRD